MTMITPSYLGETIEYSSLHACRSTLEDPTYPSKRNPQDPLNSRRTQLEVFTRIPMKTCDKGSIRISILDD